MPGNRLGARDTFSYTSDTGTVYRIETDANLGLAGGLEPADSGTGSAAPPRFSPRGLWCKSAAAPVVRRFVPCNVDNAAYSSGVPTSITIDGEAFTTTGRIGEKFSFR